MLPAKCHLVVLKINVFIANKLKIGQDYNILWNYMKCYKNQLHQIVFQPFLTKYPDNPWLRHSRYVVCDYIHSDLRFLSFDSFVLHKAHFYDLTEIPLNVWMLFSSVIFISRSQGGVRGGRVEYERDKIANSSNIHHTWNLFNLSYFLLKWKVNFSLNI